MDWETARPVLEAAYRALTSAGGGMIDGRIVNEELGRSADDESTADVLDLLARAGYVRAEYELGSAFPIIITATEKGLQQTAGWPQPGQRPEPADAAVLSPAPIDFDGLDETGFEEFCFELLSGLPTFHNVDWRKGTPKNASPADRGRDIVAEVDRTDVDGARHVETWFVDCKHYGRGIPPEALQGLLSWAQSERPHVALVIASGFLSNPAKDYIADYNENNRPPFRVKFWERPVLDKLARGNRELLDRFLVGGMRSQSEIIAAQEEFFDRVWHERHLLGLVQHESGEAPMRDEILNVALDAAERVRARRPDIRPVESDFEWGMWNGKLSALRWVLGDEWDFLDT